jgi:hypothetical protein
MLLLIGDTVVAVHLMKVYGGNRGIILPILILCTKLELVLGFTLVRFVPGGRAVGSH